jgi:hypothetical protein
MQLERKNQSERTLKGNNKSMVVNHVNHSPSITWSIIPLSSQLHPCQKYNKNIPKKIEVKNVEKREIKKKNFFVNLLLGSSNRNFNVSWRFLWEVDWNASSGFCAVIIPILPFWAGFL